MYDERDESFEIECVTATKDFAAEMARATANEAGLREGLVQTLVQINNHTGALDDLVGTTVDWITQAESGRKVIVETASDFDILTFAAGRTTAELEELVAAFAGAPEALRTLGSELQSLTQDFLGFFEMTSDADELFADFELGDDVPNEIKRLMSDSTEEFAQGLLQMQRHAEQFGHV